MDLNKLPQPQIDLNKLLPKTLNITPNAPLHVIKSPVVEELRELRHLNEQYLTELAVANQTISELDKKVSELTPKPKKWYVKFATAIWVIVTFIITTLFAEYIRDICDIIAKWLSQ